MSRRVFVGATVLTLLLLVALAGSPALHEPGESACPALEGGDGDEDGPETAAVGSAGEADATEMGGETGDADCPVDDGAEMGTPVGDR